MPLSGVFKKEFNKVIEKKLDIKFNLEKDAFYLVKVVARARAWWQRLPPTSKDYWADEELKVVVDNTPLKLKFNGNSLWGTVDDPEWTGDFADDIEAMLLARLIFGDAEDQPREAKIWVGGSVLNRVKAAAWPDTIHNVILQSDQYDPFKPEDPRYPKIIDPFKDADSSVANKWRESYGIARDLVSQNLENPTEATHFHGRGATREWFLENIVPNGRFIRQIGDTYFYWSPN